MEKNIGETKVGVHSSVTALNNLLADEYVLLAKAWNFHWNMKGPSFGSYHAFFEKLYNELIDNIDATAERIRSIDGRPIGSLKGALEHTRIKEEDEHKDLPDALGMFRKILADYETILREVRSDLTNLESKSPIDEGSVSFFQDLLQRTEKTCWMIRMHIC